MGTLSFKDKAPGLIRRLRITRNLDFPGYHIGIFDLDPISGEGRYRFDASDGLMHEIEPTAYPVSTADSFIQISEESATKLMTEMWQCGVRPDNVRFPNELIESKNQHIQDLREVVERLFTQNTRRDVFERERRGGTNQDV